MRSLFNKHIQLKQYLIDSNILCLGLSETWLTNAIPDNMLNIPGYQLIRLDRTWLNPQGQTKKGGGICCYININIQFSYIEFDQLNCSTQDGENVKKCILINIYRPPQGNIENFTESFLNNITILNNRYPNAEMILLGDFNLNVLDKKSDEAKYVKWLEQATGLKQQIEGFPRYSNNNSCIDLLFTNMVNNFTVNILDNNISDHQFIYLNRKHLPKPKDKLDFIGRSYKNYDSELFCNNLATLDWEHLYTCNNVDQAWEFMLSNITNAINIMCPLKSYKVAQAKEPWVTNEILEMIKDKDRLLRRAKNTNTDYDWIAARNARNNTNLQI